MSDMKLIVAIINFLKEESQKMQLTADTRESLEVAVQCLQTAYDLTPENLAMPEMQTSVSLKDSFNKANQTVDASIHSEAEKCKNLGNTLMKAEKHDEAVEAYTKAIDMDGNNAVYYCNRAAAYSRMGQYEAAIKDCQQAINLDPKYSKAYGRMGLAFVSMGNNALAIDCYKKAIALDPANESYHTNLKLAEEKHTKGDNTSNSSGGGSVDVNELFNNPVLRNMATTMMQDPNMFNILTGLVSSSMNERGMDTLLQAGQQFAAQMQASNPQLIEQLRQQVLGNNNSDASSEKDTPPN